MIALRTVLRFKVKHAIVALLLVGTISVGFARVADDALFRKAREAQHAGDWGLALTLFDRYVERCSDCPKAPEALLATAVALTPLTDAHVYVRSDGSATWSRSSAAPEPGVATAAERYRRLIDAYPDSNEARTAVNHLSRMFMNGGRWDDAQNVLREALHDERFRFGWPGYEMSLIDVAYAKGDYDEALQLALHFITEQPRHNHYELYLLIGDIYLERGQLDDAEASYARARAVWPEQRRGQTDGGNGGGTALVLHGALDLRASFIEDAKTVQRTGGGSVHGHITGVQNLRGRVEVLLGRKQLLDSPIPTRRRAYRATSPDDAGQFRFDDVAPGEYVLTVRYHPDELAVSRVRYVGPEALIVDVGDEIESSFHISEVIQPKSGENFVTETDEYVTVHWKPVPGAHHYSVNLLARVGFGDEQESAYVSLASGIEGTNITLAREGVFSDNVTEVRNGRGEYEVYIEARDERDVVVATSVPLVPPTRR